MIFLQLFLSFFKIGLLGFGGGYAMLSMIQGEVVTAHGWLTMKQFTDIVAISQSTPGPIGINTATYVGYQALLSGGYTHGMAVLGSVVATLSVVLPSFILMFTVTKFLLRHRHNDTVEHVFAVLRPTVVGLVAAAALLLMTEENFSSPFTSMWQFGVSIFLFFSTMVGVKWCKMGILPMLLCASLAGAILY